MSTPVAVDEKEAILSLLGLQSAPSCQGSKQSKPSATATAKAPESKASLRGTEPPKIPSADVDKGEKPAPDPIGSPVYDDIPRGLPHGDESPDSSDNEEAKQPPTSFPPKPVSPFFEHRPFKKESLVKAISKKRKHHYVIEGQFEDANETSVPTMPVVPDVADGQGVRPSPGFPSTSHGLSPPHLIKETSKELSIIPNTTSNMTRPTNSSSMSVEEQFRHFMFIQHQQQQQQQHHHQQQLSMMQGGTFSNPYFAGLMGNPASMNAFRPGEGSLDQQRLQMEAMMAFQAQMAFANLHHMGTNPNPNAMSMDQMNKIPPTPGSLGGSGGSTISAATLATSASIAATPSAAKADTHPLSSTGPKNSSAMTPPENFFVRHPPAAVAAITAAVAAESGNTQSIGQPEQISPPIQTIGRISDSDEEDIFRMKPKGQTPAKTTKIRYQKYKPPDTWRELALVPKMPPVEADAEQANLITTLGEHDVLLGRGGLTNTNPGNVSFRALVNKHRVHYQLAPKGDKGALGRYLTNYVRAMGGRFLSKASKDSDSWYDVGDDIAAKKCAQALREGSADFNRNQQELTYTKLLLQKQFETR